MSSYDRYKKKHKNDPKPEKVVLPEIGSAYRMEPYGEGIVVSKDKHSYRVLFLDGQIRRVIPL